MMPKTAILFCSIFICLLMLGSPQLQAQSATETTREVSEIDWSAEVQRGGVAMVLLALLSVTGLAVVLERSFALRRGNFLPEAVHAAVVGLWHKGQYPEIRRLCAAHPSVLSTMVLAILARHEAGCSEEQIHLRASDAFALTMRRHLQRTQWLAVIATLAPLLGLLGTVIGMIESFHVISGLGEMTNPALLAGGIYKAMVNTAAGLFVAIPAFAFYHWFKNRIAGLGIALDEIGTQLIETRGAAASIAPVLEK